MNNRVKHNLRNTIEIIENVSRKCKCSYKRQSYWKNNAKNWENHYPKENQIC